MWAISKLIRTIFTVQLQLRYQTRSPHLNRNRKQQNNICSLNWELFPYQIHWLFSIPAIFASFPCELRPSHKFLSMHWPFPITRFLFCECKGGGREGGKVGWLLFMKTDNEEFRKANDPICVPKYFNLHTTSSYEDQSYISSVSPTSSVVSATIHITKDIYSM